MLISYKPRAERKPDYQYSERLLRILASDTLVKDTMQGVGALTCFGTLAPMVFDLQNGVPLITERKLGSWKYAVAEIIAFINGARTIDEIEAFGCGPKFWGPYRGRGVEFGLAPDDMGPGSYGSVLAKFERADGTTLNQLEQLVEQIQKYPNARTHKITTWRPDYTACGENRKVIVAPCHGDAHFRVLNGKLHMAMNQRSGDMPIGVPHNMIQYAALLLMVCQVTGYAPGNYIHGFMGDAHIYENQFDAAIALTQRSPRPFPILKLEPSVKNLFDFRIEHFSIDEYNPHPPMDVPYSP
jgi:thymidylate synthase